MHIERVTKDTSPWVWEPTPHPPHPPPSTCWHWVHGFWNSQVWQKEYDLTPLAEESGVWSDLEENTSPDSGVSGAQAGSHRRHGCGHLKVKVTWARVEEMISSSVNPWNRVHTPWMKREEPDQQHWQWKVLRFLIIHTLKINSWVGG